MYLPVPEDDLNDRVRAKIARQREMRQNPQDLQTCQRVQIQDRSLRFEILKLQTWPTNDTVQLQEFRVSQ